MTTTVYLSGPISDMTYKSASDWREALTGIFTHNGLRVLDPMRGKSFLSNQKSIKREVYEAMARPDLSDKALVNRDHADVANADIVLVNLLPATKVSIGTMFELAWAMHQRKIVVILMQEGNPHDHPFVRESGVIFERMDEAVQYVLSSQGADPSPAPTFGVIERETAELLGGPR